MANTAELDRKHHAVLRRAGRNVGHSNSLRVFLPGWFAHRLGDHGSLAGIPGTHPSGRERTLAERDPLLQRQRREIERQQKQMEDWLKDREDRKEDGESGAPS